MSRVGNVGKKGRSRAVVNELSYRSPPPQDKNSMLVDTLSSVPLNAIVPTASMLTRPEHFKVQLPEPGSGSRSGSGDPKPLNQGASGRCWIFSGLNVVCRLMATKTNSRVALSHAYVFFCAWLEKCNSALETALHMMQTNQFPSANYHCMIKNTLSDGGTWDAFINVIYKYGVVPKASFPDTLPASSSTELNQVLNIIVRTGIAELQASPASASTIKDKTMRRVRQALVALLGNPPETIDVAKAGKMTPLEYFNHHVKSCIASKKFVCVTDDPRRPRRAKFWTQYGYTVIDDELLRRTYDGDLDKYVGNVFWNARDAASMQAAAKRSLDKGCPVWFSCDVRKFYSKKSMVLNASASRIDVLIGDDVWTAPKDMLYDTGVIENLHAMTFVGYDRDTGTWKVQNSWGETEALVMTDKWFERFVVSIVVPLACLDDAHDRARASNDDKYVLDARNMAPAWDLYASPQCT